MDRGELSAHVHRIRAAGMQVPTDIAVDGDGSTIIAGNFDGSLDIGGARLVGHETDDIFVIKLGPSGAPVWSKSFGDDNIQHVQRISTDADGNVLLIGHFRGTIDLGGGPLVSAGARDIFVAKLDPSGRHVWSKRFGGAHDQLGRGIAADRDGNVLIAGTLWGSVDFGGGMMKSAGWDDLFVAKLDRSGEYLWARTYGDEETQEASDLTVDGQGNVVVTGYALGVVDFGDGPTVGAGMPDAILVKLDRDGSTLWSHRFGDDGTQLGHSVGVDDEGSVVMAGAARGSIDFPDKSFHSAGGYDLYVAKFNAAGELLWHRQFGDAQDQSSIAISIDRAGAVLLTGSFEGSLDFGCSPLVSAGKTDAFAAKLDPYGDTLWSWAMGDTDSQAGMGISGARGGGVIVTGVVSGAVGLKFHPLAAAGDLSSDIFLARFRP
ncbi:SBBP repeat-containing protein [Sorangium sp. So ce185]|uniref:SBBP repeat-containing protein n=1 Tax=Sorangium sp. So ce185 TaxID=3133287 RepID=UPI003F5DFA69